MCLFVNDKRRAKIKIAKRDIICYKGIIEDRKSKIWIPALMRNGEYKYDIVNKAVNHLHFENYGVAEIKVTKSGRRKTFYSSFIPSGFHAYLDLDKAINYFKLFDLKRHKNLSVHKVIIPKGSEYFMGIEEDDEWSQEDEIVANQMIVTSEVLWYKDYRKRKQLNKDKNYEFTC